MSELEQIKEQLRQLHEKIDVLQNKVQIRVSWQDRVSDTGIQLTGGSTVERMGILVGVFVLPVGPNAVHPMLVIKRDGDNMIAVVGPADVKFAD